MNPKLRHLLNQHVVASYHKQLRLQDLVGDREWRFDLPTASLAFGDDLSFSTQVLGTESEATRSWLWSWANEDSGIPPHALKAAAKLRGIGESHGIDELVTPGLSTKAVSCYDLAMVATGLFGAGAYYRGPYDGGAVWLMLTDARLAVPQAVDAAKVVSLFTQAVMDLPITDHALAFKGYLQWLHWRFANHDSSVVATDPAGHAVTAEFDARHRLVALRAG
ncbi:MAG: hypothetical protein H0V44_08145 [Planctomycetes bacterium]|nr:hypothetical protein [Planctomycetota bacterium]